MRTPEQLPPVPLRLKLVSERLHLGVRTLASAAGIGSTPMHRLLNNSKWPVRSKRKTIEDGIRAALIDAGAKPSELSHVFESVVPACKPGQAKKGATAKEATDAAAYSPTPSNQDQENDDMLLAKQALSHEARRAFELLTNPFDGEVSSADEMFQNTEFRYCREACWQATLHGRFVAVVGESGAGKTTLLGDLRERIESERRQVVIVTPSVLGMADNDKAGKTLKSSGIMDAIIYTLDPLETPKRTMEAKTRQLQRMLEDSAKAGNVHLLVIEEAHAMPTVTLNHLKRLHELRMGRRPLMGILLLAHPELRAKLNPKRHDVREVSQRCEMVELMPLDSDLKGYLQTRLKRVGKTVSDLMDDAAVEAVRARLTVSDSRRAAEKGPSLSLVYPLAVNNFMTAALNEAASLGVPRLTRDVVMGV